MNQTSVTVGNVTLQVGTRKTDLPGKRFLEISINGRKFNSPEHFTVPGRVRRIEQADEYIFYYFGLAVDEFLQVKFEDEGIVIDYIDDIDVLPLGYLFESDYVDS